MPKRIAESTLNASTIDILNVIRQNASYEYQSLVPAVTSEVDIPKVGEVLMGHPAMANQFINALVNRIAAVRVKSANFYNMYSELKKGYLAFGETVEEVFVNIIKAREFSVEKAAGREFKRSLPDVKSAFHVMNWRVQYPVTIQDEDLRLAFLSMEGVQDLIAKIVDAVYVAAEYDEYLLFKWIIIKSIASGKMKPIAVDGSDIKNAAVAFRGTTNRFQFISTAYNEAGVHTSTPKGDQVLFLSADFDAMFDTNVLASAFNMDRATYLAKRFLIDDFTTFDNERFSEIVAGSDQIAPVSDAELALMADVIGVLVDKEFFQIYDNNNKFTEKYVAGGMYWNYFYNVWKTVSTSPFSNAVVFIAGEAASPLASFTATVLSKDVSAEATVLTFGFTNSGADIDGVRLVQNEDFVTGGVAVQPYGAIIIPAAALTDSFEEYPTATLGGASYTGGAKIDGSEDVGDTITFTLDV